MLIRVIGSTRFLPEMDLDMPQVEVNEEVFFDIYPAGYQEPSERLIYRLVGFHQMDRAQPCYQFSRVEDLQLLADQEDGAGK